jgi:hypothetical protein
MARVSTDPSGRHFNVRTDLNNTVMTKFRANSGAATTIGGSLPNFAGPRWLRIIRNGNTFTGMASLDGVNWTTISTHTISLPNTLQIGLNVLSKTASETAAARFRSFSVN